MKNIIGGAIPKQVDTECANENKLICAPNTFIDKMREYLEENNIEASGNDEIINILKKQFNVKTEAELWNHPLVRTYIGDSKIDNLLREAFKPEGPTMNEDLLDNFHIDESLAHWMKYGQQFGKKFFHIPFQMIDFALTGTELSRLDIMDLINKGYDCFGVVLNTDIHSGRGKHWFALYGDLAHKGDDNDPLVIEYFNSSGNPPMNEVSIWLEKIKHETLKLYKKKIEIVKSAPRRLQHGMNQCGLWSLYYIKSRLLGHPYNWFYKMNVNDDDMTAMRKVFFRNPLT